jgi:hypothetical protein
MVPSDDSSEPADRAVSVEEETAHRIRTFAAGFAKCLLAAGVVALGFLVIARISGWPWAELAALVWVAATTFAIGMWLRSGMWFVVVIGIFFILARVPGWLVPVVQLDRGPIPLHFDHQSGWFSAAVAAGLASWITLSVMQGIGVIQRSVRSMQRRRRRRG